MIASYLFVVLVACAKAEFSRFPNENLPSVYIPENNLDDSITQIFNHCKCVIFYLCDEQNNVIPADQVQNTRVAPGFPLKNVKRLRCSNSFYYCCRNNSEVATTSTILPESTPPLQRPYYPRPTPSSPTCGQGGSSYSRIVDEFPWIVAILEKSHYSEENTLKCGGTLIHPRVVLTAQHCVRSSTANSLKVVSNKESLNPNSRYLPSHKVSKIIKHEAYYSGGLYNDIALLILKTSITNINPVCLPRPNQNFDRKRCTAVGWGSVEPRPRRLRKVDLPIVEAQRCENLLRNTSLGYEFTLHASFLCAGGEEGKDTCNGDGGGPLMCREGNRYFQAGIVSWGLECGQRGVPSLYTNVPNLISWIESKLVTENVAISANVD